MKKLILLLVSVGLIALAPGCKKKSKKKGDKISKKHKAKIKKLKKDKKLKKGDKLTVSAYVKAWKNLSTCKLTKYAIDYKCPAYKVIDKYYKIKNKEKNLNKKLAKKAEKLIFDKSPAIRYFSVEKIHSIWFGKEKAKTVKLLLKAAKDEKNKTVLYKIMRRLDSSANKYPEIANFILKMADHPEPMIRSQALSDMADYMATDKRAYAKAVDMIKNDKNNKVKIDGLKWAYYYYNEKIIPLLKKYLDTKGKKDLYSAAFTGLVGLWAGHKCKNPSKKAYKLTVKLLKTKPRVSGYPSWVYLSQLGQIPMIGDHSKKKVPKWFNKKKHIKLLIDMAKDPNLGSWQRSGVGSALAKIKAKKALKALIKSVAKNKKDKDKDYVVKEFKKALKKIK